MTVLKVQQADRALVQKLGFEKTEDYHHIYRLRLDGLLAARTVTTQATYSGTNGWPAKAC